MAGWSPRGDEEPLTALAGLVISLCVAIVLAAVAVNFARSPRGGEVEQRRRSPVATGTMLLFLLAFYLLVHFRVGAVAVAWPLLVVLTVVGLAMVVAGTVVNLLGRLALGGNWANQVTIYRSQTLVTTGAFRLVRHPLYASLIWMFCGAALVYHNLAALLAVSLVFVPMMTVRAGQEEALLRQRFPEYDDYCRRVGRFWPRLYSGDHP